MGNEEISAGLQRYSIEWITGLLSHIGRTYGESAVEAALRDTGERLVKARRLPAERWWALDAERRAKAITRPMLANGATVEVTETDTEITLSFRCGTGGRLIDEGRYGDDGFLTLREPGPMTFGRDELPVYCAHCSIHNELQPIEWWGLPTTIEDPPRAPGEPCVHHVYRDRALIPDEVFVRLGRRPPRSGASTFSSPVPIGERLEHPQQEHHP